MYRDYIYLHIYIYIYILNNASAVYIIVSYSYFGDTSRVRRRVTVVVWSSCLDLNRT